jgi:hypothetical protein
VAGDVTSLLGVLATDDASPGAVSTPPDSSEPPQAASTNATATTGATRRRMIG